MSRDGMANLITRLREMTNTRWERLTDSATGDGTTTVYWLTHKPVESAGTVSQGGTVTGTANYTLNTADGRLEFTSAPASSVAILAEYRFSDFSDDQMEDYLESHCGLLEDIALSWYPDSLSGTTQYYRCMAGGVRDLEELSSGTTYWRITNSSGNIQGTTGYSVDYRQGLVTFTADQGGSAYYLTARTYDLNAAAADVWQMKAAVYAEQYSFSSDGQSFQRKELMDNAKAMAAMYRQRSGANRRRGDVQNSVFLRTDINRRA